MSTTKLSAEQFQRIARAISDPNRYEMLRLVFACKDENPTCGRISGALSIAGAYTGTAPQLGNTTYNLLNTGFAMATGQTTGLVINNNARITSSTDLRIPAASILNISAANARLL